MKYRVLIVDDSVVMRRIVRQSLESDPEFEVVGVAANGKIALAMVGQLSLDAITLDIEMPEMDGLETLRQLRARGITTPVVMFSTLTERGALATLDALAAGADDYVAKPSNVGNVQESMARIRMDVIPKIKALCWRGRSARPAMAAQMPAPHTSARIAVQSFAAPAEAPAAATYTALAPRVDILAIGTSTGGPNALAEVIPALPPDLPVPIVIVQHMPPTFTRFLAERLSAAAQFPVREAVNGATLQPGEAWIAPGDFHLALRREDGAVRLNLLRTPPENSCRPSVDVLFRSVAELYPNRVLAVVMTGMGQDGLRGSEHIKQARGQVIAQDEATSVVWGMPGYVAKAGLADAVLPLGDIAGEIVHRIRRGRPAHAAHVSRQAAAILTQDGDYGA